MGTLQFRVLGGSGEDFTLQVAEDAHFEVVAAEICMLRNIDSRANHVRILCGGTERRASELVRGFEGQVLHYTVVPWGSDGSGGPQVMLDTAGASPTAPTDMLDMVDPSTLLLWILGTALVVLWSMYAFQSSTFSRASTTILVVMTTAFVVPIVRSYLAPAMPQSQQQGPGSASPSGAGAGSRAAGTSSGEPHRRPGAYPAPPRPTPPVRPGQPLEAG